MRAGAEKQHVVPALLDEAMLRQYQLAPGDEFTLSLDGADTLRVPFRVLGSLPYLPMITDVAGGGNQLFAGGMMVDFQTLAQTIVQVNAQDQAPPGYMWLRSAHDLETIAQVRHALARAPYTIAGVQDRFQLLESMAYDPLSAAMVEVITFGSAIALLLALIVSGQMIGNALEQRTLNLSALYAIGASHWQIMVISASENIVELCVAAVMGLALGVALTLTAAPLITFAQSSDTSLSVVALQVPPPQMMIPIGILLKSIGVALAGVIVVVILAARYQVTRRITANLRLNED